MTRWYENDRVVLALVWVLAAAYLPRFVESGWIPHDEGVLAQSAERVLGGELPHRDFDEIYTGGLSYLHAAGFALFGIRLTSIRWVLLGFSLAFVPAVYAIARRLGPPLLAGALTVLALVWSVPNYFTGIPSWYNLFFATFATLATLRWLEDGRGRWLVAAGACAGLSILVKIAGVYVIAALVLFLVHHEHLESRRAAADDPRRPWGLIGVELVAAAIFLCGAIATFARALDPMALVHFVLPGALLAGVVIGLEIRHGRGSSTTRARRLLQDFTPFAIGIATPIVLFLLPYLATGALHDVVRGVFVLPTRRFESAAMALPAPGTLVAALPYAVLLFAPALPQRFERPLAAALAVALAALVAFAGTNRDVYQAIWLGLRPLVPLGALVVVAMAGRRDTDPAGVRRREIAFLLVAGASFVSLVQFPYAFGIYFCYAAPLVALALAAIVRARPSPRLLHLAVLAFYVAFATLWLNRGFVRGFGVRFIFDGPTAELQAERAAGIRVYDDVKAEYDGVLALVRQHARSPYIYAGPDSPELYFLAERRNPTKTLFDIFDDPDGRTARILAAIEAKDVDVVVLNTRPEFSPHAPLDLMQGLGDRFPSWQQVGHFNVGWR